MRAYDPPSEGVGQGYAKCSRSFSGFEDRLGHRRAYLKERKRKESDRGGVEVASND